MTVAVPWVLWVTAAAVAGVIGAHLLSVGRPPALRLPTARFVPDGERAAVSRTRTPRDAWLLLLRVLALVAAGLAFAGARCATSRVPVARLLVLDGRARDTASAWREALAAAVADRRPVSGVVWRDGPTVVRSTPLTPSAVDSVVSSVTSSTQWPGALSGSQSGTLAGALLRARRAAPVAARGADSLLLEVVTPLRTDATSDALAAVRRTWPGHVTVRVVADEGARATRDTLMSAPDVPWNIVVEGGEEDDVVAAAVATWTARVGEGGVRRATTRPAVRVRRGAVADRGVATLDAADSTALAAGGVLVWWPSVDTGAASNGVAATGVAATGVVATGVVATGVVVPGVVSNGVALVAPLVRRPAAAGETDTTEAIAWFLDGAPAVHETTLGAGCVREVHFAPPAGDLLLDPSARGLLAALSAPCGARAVLGARPPIARTVLEPEAVTGVSGALASRTAFVAPAEEVGAPWIPRLLLVSAIVLLLLEQWVRRTRERTDGASRTADAATGATVAAGRP